MSTLYQREPVSWRDKKYKIVFRMSGDRPCEICGDQKPDVISVFRRIDLGFSATNHPIICDRGRDATYTTVCDGDGSCHIKHRQTMAEYGYTEVHQDCTLA